MPDLGATVSVELTLDEYDETTVAVLTATPETGSPVSPTVTSDDGGHTWSGLLVYDSAGWWILSWTVTGTGAGVHHDRVYVTPAPLPALPNLTVVKVYLGQFAASWTDETIQDALDAETAAQRARCRIPATYPADLGQALKRRVQRNLAMRQQPLAVLLGDAEAGSTILPGRDPEVRRLEAPHRRMVVG